MFSKPNNKTAAKAPETTRKEAPPSILSADLRIIGNVESKGDIQIDGQVDGDISSKQVTIGESATVNGAIEAEYLRVSGTVNGEIRGRKVELANTAKVVGDIHHDLLQIEAGAYLQGLCRRIDEDDDKRKSTLKAVSGGEASKAESPDASAPAKAILDAGKAAR